MTEVAVVGAEDTDVRTALLTSETARGALATYELTAPFENAIGLETVSLGTAITLLNDLNWHLTRYASHVLVREVSIHPTEWLSRELATAVRNEQLAPESTGEYLKIYGVIQDGEASAGRLVEPLYARRTDGTVPEYDLREVEETVVVRVTEAEFR